ncbi:MAG TPA: type VI secretion system tube protein Hcp [Candidatus Limnocylindria bacterium]|nr:type VI secretion system tube protein Hcp [Candidatus Limnocylindria bacterium]
MAESWFLKIDGIDGESTDDRHKGEIDVLSWSWGVSQAGSPAVGGAGGGGAGKASFQDFHFVTRISRASPRLFLSSATGQRHAWAALSGARAGGSKNGEFLKYKLSDVLVTSVQHSGGEGTTPTEQFSLSYSKFEVAYTPSTASGKIGPSIQAGYDLKQNKKV